VERIAHLGIYGNCDTELEAFRVDGGIEVEVRDSSGTQRVRLQAGDRFHVDGEWDLWSNMAGCESRVTLLRADGTKLVLADFQFDMAWGGWQDQQVVDELKKLGYEVTLQEVSRDHR